MDGHRIKQTPILVLIATQPRLDCLLTVSLPSIAAQTRPADRVVIVSDKQALSVSDVKRIKSIVTTVEVIVLHNKQLAGAAGSWNTGIDYINEHYDSGFVAVLDDDDYWDNHHLALCEQEAHNAQLVISGIKMINNGQVITPKMPTQLTSEDFLIGNPGWQGSNTFIDLKLLNHAGKYSNGLVSCNDRDLAIRVLDLFPLIAFTGQATVNWNINHRDDALSAVRSSQKLKGVCQFYQRYQQRMNLKQKEQFFNRIEKLFKWTRDEIEKELRTITSEQSTKPFYNKKNSHNPKYPSA
ncbi:glycosyltransferase family A protein [Catenovulum sediminis]|uniref:Glycosyltransferase family 2 protein n=1 Tax=Catenovulum sediminis TaxID=1740262 RepID=A0ABV1REA8_9ALTE